MTSKRLISLALALAFVVGCLPTKRIVWAPDGRTAAVVSDHGLYMIDGKGAVLPPHFEGAVAECSWMPDGSKLIVVHATDAKTWDDIATILSPEQIALFETTAQQTRQRVLAHAGKWDDFELDPGDRFTSGMELAIVLLMRDRFNAPTRTAWRPARRSSVRLTTCVDRAFRPMGSTSPFSWPTPLKAVNFALCMWFRSPAARRASWLLPSISRMTGAPTDAASRSFTAHRRKEKTLLP